MTETTRNTMGLIVLLLVVVFSFACFWKIIILGRFNPRELVVLFFFLALFILGLIIALAHVEQGSSFGLDLILGGLIAMASQGATYMFGKPHETETKQ